MFYLVVSSVCASMVKSVSRILLDDLRLRLLLLLLLLLRSLILLLRSTNPTIGEALHPGRAVHVGHADALARDTDALRHGSRRAVHFCTGHHRILRQSAHAIHSCGSHGDLRRRRVQAVDRALEVVAVKQGEVLDWLLALAEHVDDVFREAAADERGGGDDFGADVLQERAQEVGREGVGWNLQFGGFVLSKAAECLDLLHAVHVGQAGVGALELEEGAQAGEEWRDGFELAFVAEGFLGQGRGVAEDERAVGFALGDDLGGFAVGFLFCCGGEDDAGEGFWREVGGYVGLFALDDEVVLD